MNKIFICFCSFFLWSCEKNSTLTVEKDPERPIYHRQEAFKQILRIFEPMGLMHRGELIFDLKQYQESAQKLNEIKNKPWVYFKPNTNYPPSRSLNAVWENQAEFQNEIALFENAVQKLYESSFQENQAEIEKNYAQLHQTCRSCHRKFRR